MSSVSLPVNSLTAFERLVVTRQYDEAATMALRILQSIDAAYGRIDHVDLGVPPQAGNEAQRAAMFCTRFAASFSQLVTDPAFQFSGLGFEAFLLQHRWIDLIFAVSGFGSSDHVLPMIAEGVGDERWNLSGQNILRMLSVFSMASGFDVDFDTWWRGNRLAVATAFLHYLGARTVFRARAFDLRERLLEWLPERLGDIKLGVVSLSKAPEIYMHCSYAVTPRKHAIKAAIIRQMRNTCLELGCREVAAGIATAPQARPTIIVVAEYFSAGHSIFRTHSQAVRSLRSRFHVVGLLPKGDIDARTADCFDESVPLPSADFVANIRSMVADIAIRTLAIVFYLGVGMRADVIALASLRLAPVQCVSFGHTATTMSPAIDYMVLPEDFVGPSDCYSERLLTCPKEAMPFVPVPHAADVPPPLPPRRDASLVRVAIPASIMKLNPRFFDALRAISEASRAPVEFHFFPLAAVGLAHLDLANVVAQRLPRAVAHAALPFDVYMAALRQCDLFLCPFPYGNMNSIIDAVSVGLPGVCLDGAEAHAHADVAMFARIGLPAELATATVDHYVAAAVRLISDPDWRRHCAAIARRCDLQATFFTGDPDLFCRTIAALVPSR